MFNYHLTGDSSKLDRFKEFTLLISSIYRSINKIKNGEVSEFGLKGLHVSCIYYLFQSSSALTSKQLCSICEEDKAGISRSLKYLEENNFIECKSNTVKRYNAQLILTEKGKQAGQFITNKIDGVLNKASIGLSEKDRNTLYIALKLINNNLNKICENYGE